MKIVVGLGSCGIAAGGKKIYAVLESLLTEHPEVKVELGGTGCCGMCYAEPLVEIREEGRTTLYGYVTEESVKEIFEWHVLHETPIYKYAIRATDHTCAEERFFEKQHRIVLARCGVIDPESLDEALAADAYQGLKKALTMRPEEIIEEMKASGLRGRGGAGFPTGLKWSFARKNAADQKYVICNADEGDPGAFMDRSVLEGDPHSVIEGMVIGAYAIGASEGVVYARAEYPIAVRRMQKAIEDAEAAGFLGENILGSGFSFHLQIKQGAGAFVCGEETALMASVEGKRGMPSMRPPFPAESGLFGKPSNINNVETWANVGWILLHGATEFAKLGTEKSKGTKVFALAGKIKRGGLVEVPIGMTLDEIVNDIGGGSRTGKPVKAVQLGGPSGGCVPASLFDTPVDYETIAATGAIMGSGGMIVMDSDTCMVDIARFFLNFTQEESCGKCTFCRIGTKRMLEILTRITKGEGQEGDIETLELLSDQIHRNSLCGLGQTAPNPVLTTLHYFRDEYEAHIREKRCPAGQCRALIRYLINPELCRSCSLCSKKCPVGAITGERKVPYVIDQQKCIKCGTCLETCPFSAIRKE
jgi:NADH-quinone oxidoreductase subunit F